MAPTIGTLAPPPAYGAERGSILLATAAGTTSSASPRRHRQRRPRTSPQGDTILHIPSESTANLLTSVPEWDPNAPQFHEHSRPPSPSSSVASPRSNASSEVDFPLNPPTPHQLDISLHSLSPFNLRHLADDALEAAVQQASLRPPRTSSRASYDVPPEGNPSVADRSPPAYNPIDQNVSCFPPIPFPECTAYICLFQTYAPGVAEAMLADHFAAAGASLPSHVLPLVPNTHAYEARLQNSPNSNSEISPQSNQFERDRSEGESSNGWFGGLFGGWRSQPTSPELGRSTGSRSVQP